MPTAPLQPGRDYTVDPAGRWIFTRAYLLARGKCCGSGCRNCPYPDDPDGPDGSPGVADETPAPKPEAARTDAGQAGGEKRSAR